LSPTITSERRKAALWLRMDAPRSNALTPAMADELTDAIQEAERDASVACIVLLSGGRNYCTGADLDLLRAAGRDPLADENYEGIGQIYELFCRMQAAAVPIVTGIGGRVYGAGINLALACDVRVVADDVDIRGFALAQVHPGGGHLRMLQRTVGQEWGAAVALFGQPLDAEAAVAAGFAHRRVPRPDLDETVAALAAGAGEDTALVRKVTASFRATAQSSLTAEAAVSLERAAQVWSLQRRAGD
jgi:enoyl-CoA hydratase